MPIISENMTPNDIVNETLNEIAKLLSQQEHGEVNLNQYFVEYLNKSIEYYQTRAITSDDYTRLCEAMEQLSIETGERHQKIQELFHKTIGVLREPEEDTYSIFNSVYDLVMVIPTTIGYLSCIISQTFWDYFWDGDHPWKVQKYALGLNGIRSSFRDKRMPLEEFIESIKTDPTPLQEKLLPILNIFLNEVTLDTEEIRQLYQIEYINKFRELINSDIFKKEMKLYEKAAIRVGLPAGMADEKGIESDPAVDWILQMNYFHYTDIHIYSFCERLTEMMIREGMKQIYPAENQAASSDAQDDLAEISLGMQLHAIDCAPQELKAPLAHIAKGKAQGATGRGFDPLGYSNLPFEGYRLEVKLEDGTTKTVRNLRVGTPTKQEYTILDSTTIVPEFKLLVRHLKLMQQRFLYVNLQDDRYEGIKSSAEWYRSQAIKKLHARYSENFQVVCFSMDSPFYKQEGEFEFLSQAEAFKEALRCEWLEKDNSGSFFPQTWREDPKFITLIEETISHLHADLFDSQEELSITERQVMIDTAIAMLTMRFLSYAKTDIFAAACKDGLDRAGLINFLIRLLSLIFHEEEDNEKLQKMNHVSIHGPTIIVKKQGMNERRHRLIQTKDHLLQPAIREKLRARSEEMGIASPFSIRENPDQALWIKDER